MEKNTSNGIIQINRKRLDGFLPQSEGWLEKSLSLSKGEARFRTGYISSDISIVRSHCVLPDDYRSVIEYGQDVNILAFGLSGSGIFSFDNSGRKYLVQEGDIWLFRLENNAMHRHTPAQNNAVMAAVKFTSEQAKVALDSVVGAWVEPGSRALRLAQGIRDSEYLSSILGNPLLSPLDRLMAEGDSLSLLARSLSPIPQMTWNLGTQREMTPSVDLMRVIDALISDLTHPPSLEELAEIGRMSHTKLNRIFRKTYGKTVFAWLRDYRLDLAQNYLLSDRESVTEIAFLCGFSSSSHFAAQFKEKFACSPKEYRENRGMSPFA